jgi:hypothetical protein
MITDIDTGTLQSRACEGRQQQQRTHVPLLGPEILVIGAKPVEDDDDDGDESTDGGAATEAPPAKK